MKQHTLAMATDQSFENYRKPTRRDEFLKTMEAIVPWAALCAVIEPHYPKAGNGRPPIGLERMLRIHVVQHCLTIISADGHDIEADHQRYPSTTELLHLP